MRWEGIINHYREYLPVSDKTPVVTLYEGHTPLIPADFLNKVTGLQTAFVNWGGDGGGWTKFRSRRSSG